MKLSRVAWWAGVVVLAVLVAMTIGAGLASRTEPLRRLVVTTLAERLDSDVELKAFSVDTFPGVVVRGDGLVLRLRGQSSGTPPLIQIDAFTVHSGLFDLMRRPRQFRKVTLEGLVVSIPPGGVKRGVSPSAAAIERSTDRGAKAAEESPIIVDELEADGALLRIIPRQEGKLPKEFAIHSLTMRSLGLGQQMPFAATLTNPVPKGQIETTGTFGPWQKSDPATTPLGGTYSFQNADLGTIKGLGGTLNSTGAFDGRLERIAVKGDTHSPNFQLEISGQPVALSTSFDAVVDGTDGDTYLHTVNAQFLQTAVAAKGAVVGIKGVKGRKVQLDVTISEGRIEDLLRLAVKSQQPLLVGRVGLSTGFLLPPGEGDVIERLELSGKFDVDAARFTNAEVQRKLAGMSHRARGRDPDQLAENVVSDLSGTFRLSDGSLRLTNLAFAMPGASVRLNGSYGLRAGTLNFDGTVRMDATISQAAGGGVKGFVLKMIDPIFRKKGAGAIIPIRVRGTRDNPTFGVDVGKIFKPDPRN
jgi:AsmA-like C-terminal region